MRLPVRLTGYIVATIQPPFHIICRQTFGGSSNVPLQYEVTLQTEHEEPDSFLPTWRVAGS